MQSGMKQQDYYVVESNEAKEEEDLYIYNYGIEACEPGHSYGPALRDHFLIHYILEGTGRFHIDGRVYELHENQGFLICPEIITYYEASIENPWIYTWVGFKGVKSEEYLKLANLDRNNPIFTFHGPELGKCFEKIIVSHEYKHSFELRLQGLIGIFLSELIENNGAEKGDATTYKQRYMKRALQYIESNYSREISVQNLAGFVGLNKNYFSTLFRESVGISPQEYIIRFRVNKACELLENRELSIGEIARSVGYSDQLGFSKMFKQHKGISPKAYKDRL